MGGYEGGLWGMRGWSQPKPVLALPALALTLSWVPLQTDGYGMASVFIGHAQTFGRNSIPDLTLTLILTYISNPNPNPNITLTLTLTLTLCPIQLGGSLPPIPL